MNGLEAILAGTVLVWFTVFLASLVRLVRARGPEEHEAAQRTITYSIIAGVVIGLAPIVVRYLTGFDKYEDVTIGGNSRDRYCSKDPSGLSDDEKRNVCLPGDMTDIIDRLMGLVTGVAGLVIVLGIIWGAIKLGVRPLR